MTKLILPLQPFSGNAQRFVSCAWVVRMSAAAVGLALGSPWRGLRLSGPIRPPRSRVTDPMYVAKLIEHQLAARR